MDIWNTGLKFDSYLCRYYFFVVFFYLQVTWRPQLSCRAEWDMGLSCMVCGLPRIIKSLAVLSKNARLTTDCCYWITFVMRSNPLAEPQGLPDFSCLLWEYVQGTKGTIWCWERVVLSRKRMKGWKKRAWLILLNEMVYMRGWQWFSVIKWKCTMARFC